MTKVNLASPSPREVELPYVEFAYNVEVQYYLPQPENNPERTFTDILSARRTKRTFNPVSQQRLISLLWLSAKASIVNTPSEPRWQHRPTPSAGGKHPVDLLIFPNGPTEKAGYVYDSVSHVLSLLKITDGKSLEQFFSAVDQVVAIERATIIWLIAQFDRTLSKYENGESLVWRDAGALLSTVSLVAEYLNLNCCALGITGEPFISRILDSQDKVIGVGGLLLGEP